MPSGLLAYQGPPLQGHVPYSSPKPPTFPARLPAPPPTSQSPRNRPSDSPLWTAARLLNSGPSPSASATPPQPPPTARHPPSVPNTTSPASPASAVAASILPPRRTPPSPTAPLPALDPYLDLHHPPLRQACQHPNQLSQPLRRITRKPFPSRPVRLARLARLAPCQPAQHSQSSQPRSLQPPQPALLLPRRKRQTRFERAAVVCRSSQQAPARSLAVAVRPPQPDSPIHSPPVSPSPAPACAPCPSQSHTRPPDRHRFLRRPLCRPRPPSFVRPSHRSPPRRPLLPRRPRRTPRRALRTCAGSSSRRCGTSRCTSASSAKCLLTRITCGSSLLALRCRPMRERRLWAASTRVATHSRACPAPRPRSAPHSRRPRPRSQGADGAARLGAAQPALPERGRRVAHRQDTALRRH